ELDVSADGKRIVFSTYRFNTNLAELPVEAGAASQDGALKWLTTDAARAELAPACSPDGRRVAYFTNRKGAENEGIWVVDADASNPIQWVEDERVNVFPRGTADGMSLVYISHFRGTQYEVRRVSASGGRPEKVVPIDIADSWGGVAPDGRLAFRGTG